MNDNLDKVNIKRKKLKFRSWHRGTREIDLILGKFADAHVFDFSEDELNQYEEILINNDPDLYNWITGKDPVPSDYSSDVMQKLIDFNLKP